MANPAVHYVLSRYPVDCRATHFEPLGSAGGMSGARFWRWTAPRGRLLLRRWPTAHPSADTLQWIHAIVRQAAGRGLPFLPVPIETTDGRSFVAHGGHCWELTPWLPGAADYLPARAPEKLRAAVVALARFHVAVTDLPESPGDKLGLAGAGHRVSPAIADRLARLDRLSPLAIDRFSASITGDVLPELAPLAGQFVAALPQAVPLAAGQLTPLAGVRCALQPALRDVWHDHVLFTGDRVTGLVDFGAMRVDTPAGDVARLLGSLAGDDLRAWQIGLEAYRAVRELSRDELRATAALDASGTVLAGCNWIQWIYVDGRQFENRPQVVARFGGLLERLNHLVRRGGPVQIL